MSTGVGVGIFIGIVALGLWWDHTSLPEVTPPDGQAVTPGSIAPRPPPLSAPSVGPPPKGKYVLKGVVSKVADGDTVTLRVDGRPHRVRLDSIDAPEIGHRDTEPGQPYAEASRQYLRKLIDGKSLTAQCYEKDQYGRQLCALVLPNGDSVNRQMVASGYAWAYTARRGEYLRDTAMEGLQRQAREAGRGLWAQGGPTEPWKWRYECWRNQRCEKS